MSARPRLPLFALTMRRPYAWATLFGTRRVEVRAWEPPEHVLGRYIAIHSGREYDQDAACWMSSQMVELKISAPPPPELDPAGVIAGVAKVLGAVEVYGDEEGPISEKTVLGPLTPGQVKLAIKSPWVTGGLWLWVLEDVTGFANPIPCRGHKRIWPVPDEIAVEVRKRYAETKGLRYVA